MLQGLVIGIRDGFGHPFHVFLTGLDQAFVVLLGNLIDISCTYLKDWRKSAMKLDKMRAYAAEGAVVMCCSFAFCSIGLVGYLREVQYPLDFVFS
jgi:hypothetical protein